MMVKVIRNGAGKIRNIGPWDYKWEPKMVEGFAQAMERDRPLFVHREGASVTIKDLPSEEPHMVASMVPELDAQGNMVMVAANPLPEDHYEDEAEMQEGADGALYENYKPLRRVAYPDIRDQLDAIWKGGEAAEAMRAVVLGVKERYPK